MKQPSILLSMASGFFSVLSHTAFASNPLPEAFPETINGLHRHVIIVPAKQDEQQLRIELIIGQTMREDCNKQRLNGNITRHSLSGWGYDYYQVELKPGMISTRMACPGRSDQQKFITLPAPQGRALLRYNSRIPMVIYAPDRVEVKYKIWYADPKTLTATKG